MTSVREAILHHDRLSCFLHADILALRIIGETIPGILILLSTRPSHSISELVIGLFSSKFDNQPARSLSGSSVSAKRLKRYGKCSADSPIGRNEN